MTNKSDKNINITVNPKLRHDELFRSIISEPKCYLEFFEAHLPNYVKDIIDLSSIKVEKSDFLDEKLNESICDVLFSAKIKDKSKIARFGERAYLNLLLEHQSKPDPKMALRVMKYILAICDKFYDDNPKSRKLPLVYPLIFSNAISNKNMALSFFDMFQDPELARKFFTDPIQLIDLNLIPDEDMLDRLYSGTMEFVLKHGRDDDYVMRIKDVAENLNKILDDTNFEANSSYISRILCYNWDKQSQWKGKTLKNVLEDILPESKKEVIMGSLAEQFRDDVLKKYAPEIEQDVLKKHAPVIEARGVRIAKFKSAKNMLSENLDVKIIERCTGLSASDIAKLKSGEIDPDNSA